MKRLFAAIALSALTVFPALVVAGDTLPKPEVLTEETINLSEKLSKNYDTLVIRDFTTDGAQYERVDDEERAKIDKMQPLLVSNITLSLEGELKSKKLFKNIVKNGSPTGKAVILEGKFIEYNAGSRALKFFVGFGAGKAYLRVKGRLIDARTGAELALFEDRETGYRGSMTLESFEDLFPHQSKSIGENVANFIEKLY
jgi:uncharacterized protein DUF4410